MHSEKTFLICTLSIFVLISNSLAIDVQWSPKSGSQVWSDPANWAPSYPTTADKAKINTSPGPILSAGANSIAYEIFIGESGTSNITATLSGGTLTTLAQVLIAYYTNDAATLVVDSGTLNIGQPGGTDGHLFVGFGGSGRVVVNGGTVNVTNMLGISWDGGIGRVDINGGVLNTTGFTMVNAPGGTATLNITNGKLIISGNQTSIIANYITKGWIIGFNRAGTVQYDYNLTNPGKTTVWAINRSDFAHNPAPQDNAVNIAPYTILSWESGDNNPSHNVYFGIDSNTVTSATPASAGIFKGTFNNAQLTYSPGILELGTKYYWRVDEVTDSNTFKGDVWKFTVGDGIPVDDFESYLTEPNMLSVWSADTSSGAVLNFATALGRNTSRAAQFSYDNSGAGSKAMYSQISRPAMYHDWTILSSKSIDIWYKGQAGNAKQPMYLTIEDNSGNMATVVNQDPNSTVSTTWKPWHVAFSDFAGINFTSIKNLAIGIGSKSNPVAGGSGTLYLDDLGLFPTRCLSLPAKDLNGDCRVDMLDFAQFASQWLMQIVVE